MSWKLSRENVRLFRVRSITQDCSWLCAYGFKKIRILFPPKNIYTLHHSCIHYKRFYRWLGSYRCMQHMKFFFSVLCYQKEKIKRPQHSLYRIWMRRWNIAFLILTNLQVAKGKCCLWCFFFASIFTFALNNKKCDVEFVNENSFDIIQKFYTPEHI